MRNLLALTVELATDSVLLGTKERSLPDYRFCTLVSVRSFQVIKKVPRPDHHDVSPNTNTIGQPEKMTFGILKDGIV